MIKDLLFPFYRCVNYIIERLSILLKIKHDKKAKLRGCIILTRAGHNFLYTTGERRTDFQSDAMRKEKEERTRRKEGGKKKGREGRKECGSKGSY